ncbi:Peptidyl-prolyl cis-trans isomerase CWC27 like protein [Eufriesea mexicana]|uniref:Spliceosome-associated protein CWC27 homolog n=1 Tax=Eufriesea mexicana TaxID=516756 RepID=A0A310S762_9HYME|nr:Peptidyl-prolyl cis-trans isomerase CWC27 like protein [Eufriesea mexicana]
MHDTVESTGIPAAVKTASRQGETFKDTVKIFGKIDSNQDKQEVVMKTTVDDTELELFAKERGLIVMANAGEDDNSSQFFFTPGSTLGLHNKHTIFCKVTGETIYNMLELEEVLVDENDRAVYHPRLIKIIILNNPFSDIPPRIIMQESEQVKDSSKTEAAARFQSFQSFSEEAEEDEEESAILNKKFSGKSKSAHGHLSAPKLCS